MAQIPDNILIDAANGRVSIVGLTVDQYDAMVDEGFVTEDPTRELIDGFIVKKDRSHVGEDPMTVGNLHAWVIYRLTRMVDEVSAAGAQLRIQSPIAIPPNNEPEPDGAIVRADANDYLEGHPIADDTLCIIEVSDSSLSYDRTIKKRVYAEAGIGCYVIVDLQNSRIERFSNPDIDRNDYLDRQELTIGQKLLLPVSKDRNIEIETARLIPAV